MYAIYIALIIVISVIALLGTIYAGRQSNKNVEGDTVDSDLSQSVKYENKRSSIKLLSIIYGITFLITVVIIAIIIF